MTKHNFTAGPCILDQSVVQGAADALLNFENTGLSLISISHRDKRLVAVMDEAIALTKELLNLDEDYEVLFLQGGASMQFLMTAYNLMKVDGQAAYMNTGTWSKKAIKEAKAFGEVHVFTSSEEDGYNHIPDMSSLPSGMDYVHCTSNNTIVGTEMTTFPATDDVLVCDMSSDIFSRPMDFNQFDLIYAGAQKNLGPAGTTLVAVRKSILGKTGRSIPSMLDYLVHADKESMFNTPPVFAIYTSLLTLRWIKSEGGLEAMASRANARASMLYAEIDRNPLFLGTARKDSRSLMNACFLLADESKGAAFEQLAADAGIIGIKGHRSVGGYRASMYNALQLDSVKALVAVMQKLEQQA